MLRWFRKSGSEHETAIAMIGAKAGDRLLIAGGAAVDLAAELALVTGLNGQTTLVDPDAAVDARLGEAAARAGSLVEFGRGSSTSLPVDSDSHDVVVLMAPLAPLDLEARRETVHETLRALRSGGRAIVIDGRKRTGIFTGGSTDARLPTDEVLSLLRDAGARASRLLADTEGVRYFEARK